MILALKFKKVKVFTHYLFFLFQLLTKQCFTISFSSLTNVPNSTVFGLACSKTGDIN